MFNRREFFPHLAALPAIAVGASALRAGGTAAPLVVVGHKPQQFIEPRSAQLLALDRHPAVGRLVAVLNAAYQVASPELWRVLEVPIGTIESSLLPVDYERFCGLPAPRLTSRNALRVIRRAAADLLAQHE